MIGFQTVEHGGGLVILTGDQLAAAAVAHAQMCIRDRFYILLPLLVVLALVVIVFIVIMPNAERRIPRCV